MSNNVSTGKLDRNLCLVFPYFEGSIDISRRKNIRYLPKR